MVLETGQDPGPGFTGGFSVAGAGVELAGLARSERLRTVLVVQDELALNHEHPGGEVMAVQLGGFHARRVVGDADLVIEPVSAQPGPEGGFGHGAGPVLVRHTGHQPAQQALDTVQAILADPRKRLYVNVGASTSFGWGMIGGKTSRGMAAVFTVDPSAPGGEARVELIDLR